jgi:membrane protein implicated in regulation of membrane protease activity
MDMLFYEYTPLGALFAICAIIGGVLFAIRFVMQLLGMAGDLHFFDAAEISQADAHIGDSDVSFKLLSLQGLAAFFTMFGLVGLAMEQAEASEVISLLAAVSAGAFSVWAIQKLFVGMGKLQSKGNIDLNNAIGTEGTVYLAISTPERGKVEINIQNRLRIVDAVTESGEPIQTGERVRVLKVMDSNVLVVEPVARASAAEKVS